MVKSVSIPATKKQLDGAVSSIRSDINDLARHFTTALAKHSERVDVQFSQIDLQLAEIHTKLDAIMSG